jgi:peroxiredoxin
MTTGPALDVGSRLPDTTLVDADSQPWRLHDHLGPPLVLVLHRHLA